MTKNKLSFDITNENKEILDFIKKTQHVPYGNFINSLISTFGKLPEDVKDDLLEFCKQRLQILHANLKVAGSFERNKLKTKKETYEKVANFLNSGEFVEVTSLENDDSMRKIVMKDGFLICPKDFVILNEADAKKYSYATVVECRNTPHLSAPHFVFFSDITGVTNANCEHILQINECCKKAWPKFEEILTRQVELIPDPENEGRYLNAEEYLRSPIIGYYNVYVEGDPDFPKDYKPPMGTKIVRTS